MFSSCLLPFAIQGVVEKVLNKYVGEIAMLDTGDIVRWVYMIGKNPFIK